MRLGIVGLGRMGANITRQAMDKGHQIVGYDPAPAVRTELGAEGMEPTATLDELVAELGSPRVVFL